MQVFGSFLLVVCAAGLLLETSRAPASRRSRRAPWRCRCSVASGGTGGSRSSPWWRYWSARSRCCGWLHPLSGRGSRVWGTTSSSSGSRPDIWLSGLRLSAAFPLGSGLGTYGDLSPLPQHPAPGAASSTPSRSARVPVRDRRTGLPAARWPRRSRSDARSGAVRRALPTTLARSSAVVRLPAARDPDARARGLQPADPRQRRVDRGRRRARMGMPRPGDAGPHRARGGDPERRAGCGRAAASSPGHCRCARRPERTSSRERRPSPLRRRGSRGWRGPDRCDPRPARHTEMAGRMVLAGTTCESERSALALARRALAANPFSAASHNLLGRARLAAGDHAGAGEAFDRGLRCTNPDDRPRFELSVAFHFLAAGELTLGLARVRECLTRHEDLQEEAFARLYESLPAYELIAGAVPTGSARAHERMAAMLLMKGEFAGREVELAAARGELLRSLAHHDRAGAEARRTQGGGTDRRHTTHHPRRALLRAADGASGLPGWISGSRAAARLRRRRSRRSRQGRRPSNSSSTRCSHPGDTTSPSGSVAVRRGCRSRSSPCRRARSNSLRAGLTLRPRRSTGRRIPSTAARGPVLPFRCGRATSSGGGSVWATSTPTSWSSARIPARGSASRSTGAGWRTTVVPRRRPGGSTSPASRRASDCWRSAARATASRASRRSSCSSGVPGEPRPGHARGARARRTGVPARGAALRDRGIPRHLPRPVARARVERLRPSGRTEGAQAADGAARWHRDPRGTPHRDPRDALARPGERPRARGACPTGPAPGALDARLSPRRTRRPPPPLSGEEAHGARRRRLVPRRRGRPDRVRARARLRTDRAPVALGHRHRRVDRRVLQRAQPDRRRGRRGRWSRGGLVGHAGTRLVRDERLRPCPRVLRGLRVHGRVPVPQP